VIGLNKGEYNFAIEPLSLANNEHVTKSIALFLNLLHGFVLGHLIKEINLVFLLFFKEFPGFANKLG
jgi:hypothetical protein